MIDILGFDLYTAFFVFDDFAEGASEEGDAGDSVGHRCEKRSAEAFKKRREDKDVERVVDVLDFLEESGKDDRVAESGIARQSFELTPGRTVARKKQARGGKLGAKPGQRVEHEFVALVGGKHADAA